VAVSGSFGYLGYNSGSTGTATITGAGSKWTGIGSFFIGNSGSGALRVEAGGQVISPRGYLGFDTGSTGTATITGAGSTWTNSSALFVGHAGSGELRVEAGGQVSNASGYLGDNYGSTGTATITGAGSTWTNSSELYVGRLGAGSLTITAGGLVSVRGTLTIDSNGGDDSFINMATGGMLALWGNADDSLAQFLDLVAGTDAIRYWDASLADWSPLTDGALGVDYTLLYQTAGDLTGYTLLTVGTLPPPGDFNLDGRVDGADLLAWQRGNSPTPNSPEDLATWQASFGPSETTPATTAVPEPDAVSWVGLASASLILGRRSTRGRTRQCRWGKRRPGRERRRQVAADR
jgi:T5SS/PEP-CTERM-associated repeat protein